MSRSINLLSFLLFTVVLLSGCLSSQQQNGNVELARVRQFVLRSSDLPPDLCKKLSGKDSVAVLEQYVNEWVRTTLMYELAKSKIGSQNEKIEAQIEEYRRSLYIYENECRYIQQHLDTTIGEKEISDFYQQNQEHFILKEPIVQAMMLAIPKDNVCVDEVRSAYRKIDEEGMQQLSTLSLKAGVLISLYPTEWTSLSQLSEYLPQGLSADHAARRTRNLEIAENGLIYFLTFRDWQPAGTIAPLPYARHEVKNIIINQRKVELVKNFEAQMMQEGLSSGTVKINVP